MLRRPLNLICPQNDLEEQQAQDHIRECCQEIQRGWTDKTHRIRSSSFNQPPVTIPSISLRSLGERLPLNKAIY